MIWDWFFRRKNAARDREVTDGEVRDLSSADDYVDWLFEHMLKTSTVDLTVRDYGALPGSDGDDGGGGAATRFPAPGNVINRLKILSGLDPVALTCRTHGRFQIERGNHVLKIDAEFSERNDRSCCRLRMSVRRR